MPVITFWRMRRPGRRRCSRILKIRNFHFEVSNERTEDIQSCDYNLRQKLELVQNVHYSAPSVVSSVEGLNDA